MLQARLGAGEAQHVVARAGDEQRRLRDFAATPGRHQLSGASNAAVPIEPAAKAGALEFAGHIGDVLSGQPVGQRCWLDGRV